MEMRVKKKIKLTSVIEIRTMVAYGRISKIRSDHRIFCIGGNILHFIWVYLIRIHLRILPYINFYPKIKNSIQCLMLIISLILISTTQPSTPAPLTSCHSSSFVLAILSAWELFRSQIAAIWVLNKSMWVPAAALNIGLCSHMKLNQRGPPLFSYIK